MSSYVIVLCWVQAWIIQWWAAHANPSGLCVTWLALWETDVLFQSLNRYETQWAWLSRNISCKCVNMVNATPWRLWPSHSGQVFQRQAMLFCCGFLWLGLCGIPRGCFFRQYRTNFPRRSQSDGGGHLHFPLLELRILPKAKDSERFEQQPRKGLLPGGCSFWCRTEIVALGVVNFSTYSIPGAPWSTRTRFT